MKNRNFSHRVLRMKPSATLQMAAAARELAEAGTDVVALSAGEPDFTTPQAICQVGIASIAAGKTHYSPVRGNKAIIEAMQEKFLRDQGVPYDKTEVMCTVGAKSAIYLAIEAIVNDGDEVIIFAPYWVSYVEQVRLAGGTPVVVNCTQENNFMPTKDAISQAITPKTKAVILNSPNNPTGGVISKQQLTDLASVLENTDIWLISDEIYEKLLFGDNQHISPASLSPSMKERTVVISGASKGYAMTGWRVGVVAGNKAIIAAMADLQGQQNTSNPEFVHDAAAFALKENAEIRRDMEKMFHAYAERRAACLARFKSLDHVRVFPPQGAFYVWADFSHYLGIPIQGKTYENDIDLVTAMLKEAHVACVPGSPFGAFGFVRMSIASSISDINKAMDRIHHWLKNP